MAGEKDVATALSNAEVNLNVAHLDTPEALLTLGVYVAELLRAAGTATFVVGASGEITFLPPTSVFVLSHEEIIPKDKVPQRGRPVLLAGRPNFVTIEDGVMYEVEFVDPIIEGEQQNG